MRSFFKQIRAILRSNITDPKELIYNKFKGVVEQEFFSMGGGNEIKGVYSLATAIAVACRIGNFVLFRPFFAML